MTGGIIQLSDEFHDYFMGLSKTRKNYSDILRLLVESLDRLKEISGSINDDLKDGRSESVYVTDFYRLFGGILDDAMNLLFYGPFFPDQKKKIDFKEISNYLLGMKDDSGECKHEFWPSLKAKLGSSEEICILIRKLRVVYFRKRNPSAHTSLPTAIDKFSEDDFEKLKSFMKQTADMIDELVEEGI